MEIYLVWLYSVMEDIVDIGSICVNDTEEDANCD